MSWLYLGAIVGSTACMALVDHRWRLFLPARPARAIAVVAAGMAFFLAWDLVAISLDIYQRGDSPAMTGIEVARELPLEELLFVLFFCYLTLVLHGLLRHLLAARTRPAPTPERVR